MCCVRFTGLDRVFQECMCAGQVSTVGFRMDTSVFWASNMFIRPAFLLPQPPHHLKNI